MKLIIKKMANVLLVLVAVLIINPSYSADRAATERTGDTIQILIPAVGLASALLLEDARGTHFEGAREWAQAFITFEAVTEGLKWASHKQRPNGQSFKSFPSGHTAAAFMGATFIHRRYGFSYAIPAYAGAAFVGYSRMQAKKHYGEDVFAGAAIGMASSLLFTTKYKGVTFSPMASKNTIGMNFSKQW